MSDRRQPAAAPAGMTVIVKTTARLLSGFVVIFAIYIALTGHLSPGGGFAGGVILAAGGVLLVLAFGRRGSGGEPGPAEALGEGRCHVADAAGALAFLGVALAGYAFGSFFVNFVPPGQVGRLSSGGTIPLSNMAILIKVAAGVVGVFVALAGFRVHLEGGDMTWESQSIF